jgi:hypothetical protein
MTMARPSTRAITATQHIMESFIRRAKSADCADITSCDFTNKSGLVKYLIAGKPITCFMLADKWAPEAIQSAHEGLSRELADVPQTPISSVSEVAREMGASDEEMVMVAGFAGGLGLSGNACGALGAAIWMNTLARVRHHNYSISDAAMEKIFEAFYEETCYEIEWCKISGQCFTTTEEYSAVLKNGGCEKLIHVLAEASSLPQAGR